MTTTNIFENKKKKFNGRQPLFFKWKMTPIFVNETIMQPETFKMKTLVMALLWVTFNFNFR
jgi:hypothetical protein